MKTPKAFLFIFAALLAFGAIVSPRARAQVSVDFFYDNLSQYGEWVDCQYGYCWHPTNVAPDWAPYTDGYWAYTDQGWTWVSYEDYGGIVYHYGRWVNLEDEGWVWVPGTQWAPAWVSWRRSPDYVGWAPLPPEAHFQAGFGFGGWVDARFDIGPGNYNFVRYGDFGAPALGGVIVNREQNVTIIHNTTNITNITTNNTTIYNGGPSYTEVAARSSHAVPTLHLVRQTTAGADGKVMSHQQGNQLMVVAPRVTAPAGGKFPAPSKVAKTLSTAKAEHGWSVVKDPQQRAALQAEVKSKAPKYAAAKTVNPADVKLVTEKAKVRPKNELETSAAETKPVTAAKTTTANDDLLNKPATEAATPKPAKIKKHTQKTAGAGATPGHKKKSKKSPTPSEAERSGTQPLTAGDETPKVKRHTEAAAGHVTADGEVKPKHHPGTESATGQNGEPKKKKAKPEPTA
jgi:NACalpha-BTF3-like transcription factor